MSDSTIKVSEMPRADGLENQDILYVVKIDGTEMHSKSCAISVLTSKISSDVGIENIKNDVNDHTASINNISNNITAINDDLSEHAENINTLSTNTTQLSTTVNLHTGQITRLQLSVELATIDVSEYEKIRDMSSFYAYPDEDEFHSNKSKVGELSAKVVNEIAISVDQLNSLSISETFDEIDKLLTEIASYNDSGIMSSGYILELSAIISSLYDDLYPVDSIYTTTLTSVPEKLKTGGKTWQQLDTDLTSINFFKRTK